MSGTMILIHVFVFTAFGAMQQESAGSAMDNWMANFGDCTIFELAIAGTHDSATYTSPSPKAKCQELDIPGQLNAGVRSIDIRVGVWDDSKPKKAALTKLQEMETSGSIDSIIFQVGHGPSSAMGGAIGPFPSPNIDMESELTAITTWLTAHQTEVVRIKIKWETKDKQLNKKATDQQSKFPFPNVKAAFVNKLVTIIGPFLAPPQRRGLPIGKWNAKEQIILECEACYQLGLEFSTLDPDFATSLWSEANNKGEYSDAKDLDPMLKKQKVQLQPRIDEHRAGLLNPSGFYSFYVTLTTQFKSGDHSGIWNSNIKTRDTKNIVERREALEVVRQYAYLMNLVIFDFIENKANFIQVLDESNRMRECFTHRKSAIDAAELMSRFQRSLTSEDFNGWEISDFIEIPDELDENHQINAIPVTVTANKKQLPPTKRIDAAEGSEQSISHIQDISPVEHWVQIFPYTLLGIVVASFCLRCRKTKIPKDIDAEPLLV